MATFSLQFLLGTHREPAECVIKVGAALEEITDFYPFLTEVTVECTRDEAAVATLSLETRRDEQGQWLIQDAGVFTPWAPIRIEAAFGSTTEEVFRGYIREVRAEYPEEPGAAVAVVECQDESIRLDREQVRRAWGEETPTTDRAILSEILSGRTGLSLHTDSADGQSNLVLNQNGTDIVFLRQRARANGYELIFREGTAYFGPMRLDAERQATIMVYAGPDTNCLSFTSRADGHQPDRVAFDVAPEEGEEVVTETVEPDLPLLGTTRADSSASGLDDFTWRLSREGGGSEEQLRQQAQRMANEASMRVHAEGELDGSLYGHVLLVGLPVGVDGVGDWLGGTYYVDKVTHRFTTEGYRQSFELLRNAYGDDLESGGLGALSGIL